jgi:hypothetical protein
MLDPEPGTKAGNTMDTPHGSGKQFLRTIVMSQVGLPDAIGGSGPAAGTAKVGLPAAVIWPLTGARDELWHDELSRLKTHVQKHCQAATKGPGSSGWGSYNPGAQRLI